jgi:hypothetical protein
MTLKAMMHDDRRDRRTNFGGDALTMTDFSFS